MLDDTLTPAERSRLVSSGSSGYTGGLGDENGADLESELIDAEEMKSEMSMLQLVSTFKMQLLAVCVYGFLGTIKAVSFFPFLRTTIDCVSSIPPEDRHSTHWSGSPYCTDLAHVAREAQYFKGVSEGLDQAFHCLLLPALGHAIDCFGRRWGVLFGMTGVTLQCLFYWCAALSTYGSLSHFFVITGSIIQGGSGIFMAALNASIRDVQLGSARYSKKQESHAYGLLQVFQGGASFTGVILVTWLVVSNNLSTYNMVWFVISMLSLAVLWYLYTMFEETLPKASEWKWENANPFTQLKKLGDTDAHKWIALALFFSVLALSSLSVFQAFTVAQYHWSQTKSTTVFMFTSPFMVISLAGSFYLIPRVGPVRFMSLAFAFGNLGMFFLCLAGLDEVFAYLGLCSILLTIGAGPAYMQILSDTIEENEIGQILANMGAVALGAVAVGNIGYGVLFRNVKDFKALSFVLAFPLIVISTYFASKAKAHIRVTSASASFETAPIGDDDI